MKKYIKCQLTFVDTQERTHTKSLMQILFLLIFSFHAFELLWQEHQSLVIFIIMTLLILFVLSMFMFNIKNIKKKKKLFIWQRRSNSTMIFVWTCMWHISPPLVNLFQQLKWKANKARQWIQLFWNISLLNL